jgi:GDP-L-fucose synthase
MTKRYFIAGHNGLVGSAILRTLLAMGVGEHQIVRRTRKELDLCNQLEVQKFFDRERPTQVYMAAARVGGIQANNTYPAEFIYENLMVQAT